MGYEKHVDQQLVKRVQHGDKLAFDLLVIKYQHRLFGLISRYVHDPTEIQDVAQETFIKAYRSLDNFRNESAFYTWLYRIAVNTAKNHLVSKGRRPPDTDIDTEDAEYFVENSPLKNIENPENNLYCEELKNVVTAAVNNLPKNLRTAVTLREFDGLSYAGIADVMKCPVGTVRSRIFRGRDAIAREVKLQMEGMSTEDKSLNNRTEVIK